MGNKNTGSLDTNVLLRLLLDDVPSHTVLVENLFNRGTKYHVADAALIEMVFVLEKVYALDRELICENVQAIIQHSHCVTNRSLFVKALPLYLAHPKLSIMDCCLLVYARNNKATPLYSFDASLAKVGGVDVQRPG